MKDETYTGSQIFGSVTLIILLLAWWVFLPTVGVLYLCGYLP